MRWWQIRKRRADLDRELRSDLELEEEEHRERGLCPEEARLAARRAGEIGIRMALGVQRAQITLLILRETLLLVIGGLAIGLPGAAVASRLISSELFGLKPWDPFTFLTACWLMSAVALFAAYIPAHRAASIDFLQVLRTE
jgi:ABC-type antimicrobial peptide transport system permease subunit